MNETAGATSSGGGLIILATFLVGLMLSQIPLPHVIEWARPEWVAMILIYWVMATVLSALQNRLEQHVNRQDSESK